MTLINATAKHHLQNSSKWESWKDATKAIAEVDNSVSEEMARENFGGPNHNDQWIAVGDIVELSENNSLSKGSMEAKAMNQGFLAALTYLPEKPAAHNIGPMLEKAEEHAPKGGPERAPYLLALTMAGAAVSARFATEKTLELLKGK